MIYLECSLELQYYLHYGKQGYFDQIPYWQIAHLEIVYIGVCSGEVSTTEAQRCFPDS